MAWPAGEIISIVREAYASLGSIRAVASELGVAIGTVQDMLVNPERPRQLSTLLQIQERYQQQTPRPEPGAMGTVRVPTDTIFQSHLRDLQIPRNATGWMIIHKDQAVSSTPSGYASTGWNSFDAGDPATFAEELGINPQDVVEVRFGVATGP